MSDHDPEGRLNRPLETVRLGQMSYRDARALMEARAEARRSGSVSDALLLVEHVPPVLTLGRRREARANILVPSELLESQGIEVVETVRGGDVTYHGPGQVVGYPVISLRPERMDVRRYVSDLEAVMIDVCSEYGIRAGRSPGEVGCWVDGRRKVGAIGVRISRWVTSHGFALNVSPDMRHFGYIVPCGIRGKAVTSLELELGRSPPMTEVMDRCESAFRARFGQRVASS